MAYAQKLPSYISPQDHLLREERATTRHEYLDGVIYDWQGGMPRGMAGGTVAHAQVTLNVAITLRNQLRGTPCKVVASEVRLNRADKSAYFYPDTMVSGGEADLARNDGFSEPLVIVEVLSNSTEAFDRGDKFKVYQGLSSPQSYVLISPDRRTIEIFQRSQEWAAQDSQEAMPLSGPEIVALGASGLHLRASDVFEGV